MLVKINVQVTVKPKALSCWILKNVPNENCSLLTEKKTKSRRQNEPKNPPRKEQGKGKQTERGERKEEKKKSNGCTLSFYVSSAKDLFMGPGTTILDRVKWNSKPPSPQIKDEAALKQPAQQASKGVQATLKPKRTIFLSLIQGGEWGTNFPSTILSKIVACSRRSDRRPPSICPEGGGTSVYRLFRHWGAEVKRTGTG